MSAFLIGVAIGILLGTIVGFITFAKILSEGIITMKAELEGSLNEQLEEYISEVTEGGKR